MSLRARTIYADTEDGAVQLGSSADRWHLADDHVHLAPHHEEGDLLRFEARLLPIVDNPDRGALVVVDMQNDFCAPGGWTETSGLDHERCRRAIPGVQRAIDAARSHGMWVIWVYWHNRPDLRNLGAPTLYSFKHDAVLLRDACATSSPDYCYDAVVFNAENCWGFSMSTQDFAEPRAVG